MGVIGGSYGGWYLPGPSADKTQTLGVSDGQQRSARVSEGLCVQTMPSLLESKNPKVSLCSMYPLDMFLVTALFYLPVSHVFADGSVLSTR